MLLSEGIYLTLSGLAILKGQMIAYLTWQQGPASVLS